MTTLEAKRAELAQQLEHTRKEQAKLRERELRLQGGLIALDELIQQEGQNADATTQTD